MQHTGVGMARVAACVVWSLVCCVVLSALPGHADVRELRVLPSVYPDTRGVTRVNLSVVVQRVRIPLSRRTPRDKQLYFEYTGRLYALDNVPEYTDTNGSHGSGGSSSRNAGGADGAQGRHADTTPMLPGPCIHVVPGGKLIARLTNRLGAERDVTPLPIPTSNDSNSSSSSNGRPSPPPPSSRHRMHTFHSPNTTNLHFHGMHSDPNIDNPFLVLAPGDVHTYKLRIPRSHIPGYHWYHAHHHGSVYYQVMSGLFGPMLVDDGTLMTSPVHPFRSWPQHVLLVHLYRLTKSSVCDGATLHEVDDAMATHAPARPRIVDDDGTEYKLPSDLFLVNGQHQPAVSVMQSTPTVLHIGYAAGSCYVNVSLPRSCVFHVAAYDGVPLQHTQTVTQRWLYFTTATRIDVVVVCNKPGVVPVRLHWGPRGAMGDDNDDDNGGGGGSKKKDTSDVLFYLAVRKQAGKATRRTHFPVALPRYNADYLDLNGKQTAWHDISLSQLDVASRKPRPFYVLGQGSNCSSLRSSSTCAYSHFMGSMGDNTTSAYGFSVPLYTVLTAHLYGDPTDAMPHPFHFHVNHFRFIAFEPRRGGMHANHSMAMYGIHPGQFRDTIPVLDGVTTVQWQVASYTGEVVYHCHNLAHEDHGMMLSYMAVANPHGAAQGALDLRRSKTPAAQPPASSSSLSRERRGELPLHGRAYFLVLALLFFAASGVALGWQWMRHHPHHLEAVAQSRTALAGHPVALTSDESAPLLAPS